VWERKPVGEFPANTSLKSGLSSWCRRCHAAVTKAWRDERRAELNTARRRGRLESVCGDCGKMFKARSVLQVRCPACQAAMRQARKR
jgi:hypothetical protein